MRKKEETSRKDTCLAHAHPEEMVFVLLGRDVAAPAAIRAWVAERLRLGKNSRNDAQIVEALACADTMVKEGRQWVGATTPAVCERCQGKATHYTVDGIDSKLVCDAYPNCASLTTMHGVGAIIGCVVVLIAYLFRNVCWM